MRPKIVASEDVLAPHESSAELEPAGAGPAAPMPATGADQQRGALLQLLRCGDRSSLGTILDCYLDALGLGDQPAPGLLDYALTDGVLLAAGFLRELGGMPETILPGLGQLEALRGTLSSREEARALIGAALEAALDYRDSQPRHQALVARAKYYIETHYDDPDLSLARVADDVMLSPSYFSTVFRREVGQSFVEYLTRVRIDKAMELLRTTALTSTAVGQRVGYLNPRYFHVVFRKLVGTTPLAFRRQGRR